MPFKSGKPIVDETSCVACGLAFIVALRGYDTLHDGWRIVLGGSLGRHPRLATPLLGIHNSATLYYVVKGAIRWRMKNYSAKERFAKLVDRSVDKGAFLLSFDEESIKGKRI